MANALPLFRKDSDGS